MKNIYIILLFAICYTPKLLAQSGTTADTTEVNAFYPAQDRITEQMPSFPGGTALLYKYIAENLQYPAEAFKKKITGKVVVQFVVAPSGEVRNVKVVQGLGYGCDEEAIRLVESMNVNHKWVPGMHNGRSVPVTFTLPLKFHLQ